MNVFHFRDFRLLLLSQLFIGFTQPVLFMTQSWYISEMAPENLSALFLGIKAALSGAVFIGYMVLAGAIVDRFPRRTVMRVSQIFACSSIVVVSVFLHLFSGSDPSIFRLLIIIGLFCSFGIVFAQDQPNRVALVRDSLGTAMGSRGLSLFFLVLAVGGMGAGPTGGWLIENSGYSAAYLFAGIGPLLAVGLTFYIRVGSEPADSGAAREGLFNNIINGYQVLRELPIVRFVLFLNWTSIAIGLGVMGQLIASWVDQKLGFGALDWGIMILTWTVGGVISTLIIAGLGARLRRGPTLLLAVSLFGAAVFLYSLSRANVFVFSFNLICGACFFAINALSTGIIQSVVENKVLGRVNSFIFMSQGMMQIAALLLGALATMIGLQFVYSGAGLVILLFGIIMTLRNQTLRDFR